MISSRDFFYLRHGQTDWNLEGRLQGRTDIPLNTTGIAQARDAACRLKSQEIHRIVSSPLIRALKTAAIVGEYIELPVYVDSLLSERCFGKFEGLTIADIKQQHGLSENDIVARNLPHDAEQWPETITRSCDAIEKWLVKYPGEKILFVAHSGIFKALTKTLCGSQIKGKNATPYSINPSENQWTVSEVE